MVYGFGQELAEDQPGMGTTFIQSDFVGSPSVTTDPSGAVIGRSKNLPFGERFGQWGQKTIRRYTNHEEDPDSNAIYMQAREYLPAYGKFAEVDPAYDQTKDDPESWNLYNYVTNNPVTHTDPDGRYEVIIEGLIVTRNNDVLDELGVSGSDNMGGGGGPPVRNWDPQTGVIYLGSHLNADNQVESTYWLPGSNGDGATQGASVSAQTTTDTGNYSPTSGFLGFIAGGPGAPIPSGPPPVLSPDHSVTTSTPIDKNGVVEIINTQLYPVYEWNYTPHWGPIPTGVPHTFLQTPNMTRGYYPIASWHYAAALITSPGEVRNDAGHPHNDTPAQTFWVDATTLNSVEKGMNWSPQFYELNNGFWNHAYNCTGWANQVLRGAGLNSAWGGVGANPWTN